MTYLQYIRQKPESHQRHFQDKFAYNMEATNNFGPVVPLGGRPSLCPTQNDLLTYPFNITKRIAAPFNFFFSLRNLALIKWVDVLVLYCIKPLKLFLR